MTPQEIESFWNEHKSELYKLLSKEQQKPLTHAKLHKAFVDLDGKWYYRFVPDVQLPIERIGQKKKQFQLLNRGLTDHEDKKFDDKIAEVVLNGTDLLDVKKKVSWYLGQKETRRQMVIHTEIFYNLVALELVREDESPELFDNDIQMEKVKMFKRMTRDGSTYFFFQQTELKSLSTFFDFTPTEWDRYWMESLISQQMIQEVTKTA